MYVFWLCAGSIFTAIDLKPSIDCQACSKCLTSLNDAVARVVIRITIVNLQLFDVSPSLPPFQS